MNQLEDMARQVGTDAYEPGPEARTCGKCDHVRPFGVLDGKTMHSVLTMPWKGTGGAIKAVNAIREHCGWCRALDVVVTLAESADDCADWEES